MTADEFAAIYARYRLPILHFLGRLVSSYDEAEDLAADAWLKAWRSFAEGGSIVEASTLAHWLFEIAQNTAYDALRRCRRIQWLPLETIEATAAGHGHFERSIAEWDAIARTLARLLPLEAQALWLHEGQGFPTRAIAAATGASNSAIKTRVQRARQRFAVLYRQEQAG